MNNYTIKRYQTVDFDLWNAFIDQAVNGTFLFHRNFVDYHEQRFEDHSIMVFDNAAVVAVLPAHCIGNQLFSHRGLTFGGFVFDNNVSSKTIASIIAAVWDYVKKQSLESIEIQEILPYYAPLHFSDIQSVLKQCGATIKGQKMNLAINFRTDYSVSKSKLKHYRRLQLLDLHVKKETDFESFWKEVLEPLLLEKYQTQPVHSLAEIQLLQSRFPENIEQYNLYHEGEILAGVTLFKSNKVIKSQYGATTEKGKKFRALDYLFLFLMDKFKDKYDYFDMGTVNDDSELGYNEGLLNQKKELGCIVYSQNIYQIAL